MEQRDGHPHEHGPGCGHKVVRHGDHADYLHDGRLHSPGGAGVEEHVLEVDRGHPNACAPVECPAKHHPGCGHPRVLHGDHCDIHGTV